MSGDLEALQGTWNIVKLTVEGNLLPSAFYTGAQIIVKDSTFTTKAMGAVYEGDVVIDQTATPRTFDLKFTSGPEKGNLSLGIYELNGDEWRVCLGFAHKPRPTAFESKPGTGHALEELKRA